MLRKSKLLALLKEALIDLQRNDDIWETAVETAKLSLLENCEEADGDDAIDLVRRYVTSSFWRNHTVIANDTIVIGTILAELAQRLACVPLDYEVIPDYDAINNENRLAFYLVLALKHNQKILRPAHTLAWACAPESFESFLSLAHRIAGVAKEVISDEQSDDN